MSEFTVNDFETADRSSSTFTHLVNFTFTDCGTMDAVVALHLHTNFLFTDCELWTAVVVQFTRKFVAGYSEVALM